MGSSWARCVEGLLGWPAKSSSFTCVQGRSPVCILPSAVHLFCVLLSVYFTTESSVLMSPLGVHITYSLAGVRLFFLQGVVLAQNASSFSHWEEDRKSGCKFAVGLSGRWGRTVGPGEGLFWVPPTESLCSFFFACFLFL